MRSITICLITMMPSIDFFICSQPQQHYIDVLLDQIATIYSQHPYIDIHLSSPTLRDQLHSQQNTKQIALIPWLPKQSTSTVLRIRPLLEANQTANCIISDQPLSLEENTAKHYQIYVWPKSPHKQALRELYKQAQQLAWQLKNHRL